MTWNEFLTADKLNRADDIEFLTTFLLKRVEKRGAAGQPKSYVLNVDAGWGRGKTFFLPGLSIRLKGLGHPVAMVNAWRDDHADDPILSVMAGIEDAITPHLVPGPDLGKKVATLRKNVGKVALAAGKGAVMSLGRRWFGEAAEEIGEIAEQHFASDQPPEQMGKRTEAALVAGLEGALSTLSSIADRVAAEALTEFRRDGQSIQAFRDNLAQLLAEVEGQNKPMPLFVLVDELDRCRPPYAIAMLERIKHLFDIGNMVFVVATDTNQLAHAIGAVYGRDFESQRYLGRFFDRRYSFPDPKVSELLGHLMRSQPIDISKLSVHPHISLAELMEKTFETFALSIRDIEQGYYLLRTIVTTWDYKIEIEAAVMLPMVAASQLNLLKSNGIDSVVGELRARLSSADQARLPRLSLSDDNGTTIFDLLDTFVQLSAMTFGELAGKPQLERSLAEWVQAVVLDEGKLLRRGSRGSHSILRQYPALVQTAGRLKPSVQS